MLDLGQDQRAWDAGNLPWRRSCGHSSGDGFRKFGAMRRRRNELEYQTVVGDETSQAEAETAITDATTLLKAARQLLPALGLYGCRRAKDASSSEVASPDLSFVIPASNENRWRDLMASLVATDPHPMARLLEVAEPDEIRREVVIPGEEGRRSDRLDPASCSAAAARSPRSR